MADRHMSTKSELVLKIDAAWAEFESCLAGLTESQMTELRDDQGWNIKDHITHLAAWEESVAMLFEGKPRYQTLGFDQSNFSMDFIDEINANIRDRWRALSIDAAIKEFRNIHKKLIALIQGLSDADLSQTCVEYFSKAVSDDERRVIDIIQANTDYHFLEHLAWIKILAKFPE